MVDELMVGYHVGDVIEGDVKKANNQRIVFVYQKVRKTEKNKKERWKKLSCSLLATPIVIQ